MIIQHAARVYHTAFSKMTLIHMHIVLFCMVERNLVITNKCMSSDAYFTVSDCPVHTKVCTGCSYFQTIHTQKVPKQWFSLDCKLKAKVIIHKKKEVDVIHDSLRIHAPVLEFKLFNLASTGCSLPVL
jgi:hypothetical protein